MLEVQLDRQMREFSLDYQRLQSATVSAKDLYLIGKCPAAEIPPRFRKGPHYNAAGLTRPLIMGRFFHNLAEDLNEAVALGLQEGLTFLTDRYFELIKVYEARYAEFISEDRWPFSEGGHINDILEANKKLFMRQLMAGSIPNRETDIKHSNGLLLGRIDELELRGTTAIITDYKLKFSVSTINTSTAREQLHFYSALVQDQYPGLAIELSLIGLRGSFFEVALEEELLSQIFHSSVELATRLRRIGSESTPLSDLCAGCSNCEHALDLEEGPE